MAAIRWRFCGADWQVLAVDKETEAIARLIQRTDLTSTHLQTQVEAFEILRLSRSGGSD
jgi:hypothetical protein